MFEISLLQHHGGSILIQGPISRRLEFRDGTQPERITEITAPVRKMRTHELEYLIVVLGSGKLGAEERRARLAVLDFPLVRLFILGIGAIYAVPVGKVFVLAEPDPSGRELVLRVIVRVAEVIPADVFWVFIEGIAEVVDVGEGEGKFLFNLTERHAGLGYG